MSECEDSEGVFQTAVFRHSPEVQREGPWCGCCSSARRWKRVGSNSSTADGCELKDPRGMARAQEEDLFHVVRSLSSFQNIAQHGDDDYKQDVPMKTV